MSKSNVHRTLERLVDRLTQLEIPYAVVGAMAIELKLASGMTAPHRLRDLADVIELIRINELKQGLAESLDPYVRAKYLELWQAAQIRDDE